MEKPDDTLPILSFDKGSNEHGDQTIYPPKYQPEDQPDNKAAKSIISLALYLAAGYYFFPDYKILFLITIVIMIHELGHFIAMKMFGYNDLGIFFIPLLGAYVSGTKREVSQRQSAIILLAGPIPGILIGSAFFLIDKNSSSHEFFGISYKMIGLLFILLNLINLAPVYPLDGGQLLNRVFLDEESMISKIFVFLSAAFMCWIVWIMYSRSHNPVALALLIFPLNWLLRQFTGNKLTMIEKRLEAEKINTDIDYSDLPDADYWKIRDIIIEESTTFKGIPPSPPYEFDEKEEKIMLTIQSLLHRHLIQDLSVAEKILILIIWVAAIASPWLVNVDMDGSNWFRN